MQRVLRSFKSKGEGSSRRTRHERLVDTINDGGFGHIEFVDDNHRQRFVDLMGRPMTPTRFIDQDALHLLGIARGVRTMLFNSGCQGLFTMCEHTYRCLTLEFLSSFHYDEDEPAIEFRLFNEWKYYYPERWGELLGCCAEGVKNYEYPRDGTNDTWKLLTGLERGGRGWKFRAHYIQHPEVRMWCRIVSSGYFGRPELTNMKAHEIQMLFSTLNADGGEPFVVDVAHHVAQHFQLVADGLIGEILVGGLITHLAKQIFGDIGEAHLILVPANENGSPLTIDIDYLLQCNYLKEIDAWSWWWKLKRSNILRLPEEVPYTRMRQVFPFPPGYYDENHYLLVQAADRQDEDAPIGAAEGAPIGAGAGNVAGIPLIEPTGNYDGFNHYPFNMGPYRPPGLNVELLPPTFATFPPFAHPQTWNTRSQGAMIAGLCNQMQQANLHHSLAAHNIYAYHHQQGHLEGTTQHPAFFRANMAPQPRPPHQDNQGGFYEDPPSASSSLSDQYYCNIASRYAADHTDTNQEDESEDETC